MSQLVLASTSPYRKALLEKLGLPFETRSPNIDESPLQGESPAALVARLAEAKARAIAPEFCDALIIGSDQVAVLENKILGKPGNHQAAVEQLRHASGKRVDFLTGLCLYNTKTRHAQVSVVPYTVVFRELSLEEIDDYLRREQPYDCAGSFKSEGLGIALFQAMEGQDPNALIGLPMIELCRLLAENGMAILGEAVAR